MKRNEALTATNATNVFATHGLRAIPAGLWLTLLGLAYLTITVAPIVLAWHQGLPPRPFLDELSSALAMTGFAILLVEFVLSGRFRAISDPAGIDLTMRFHQLLARMVVLFAFLHPVLYTLPLTERPWDHTRATVLGLTPEGTISGLAAWALMVMLVVLAIYRDQIPYRYETWRLTHGIGAALLAIFALHHTVHVGRYALAPASTLFWAVATALALASLAFVYVVKPIRQARRPYAVTHLDRIAERTWQVVIEPIAHRGMRFQAGQFVWLKVGRALLRLADHPFSISSSPSVLPRVEFLIKEAGDFTGDLKQTLKPGTHVYLDGPHGDFTLDGRRGRGIVFIVGGVGIAPALSLLRALAAARYADPVILVYGNRIQAQIVCVEELDHHRQTLDLTVHHVLTEPPPDWTGLDGPLSHATLSATLPERDRGEWLYFVCGPTPMIDAIECQLHALGVPMRQIAAERFRYDAGHRSPRERTILAAMIGLMTLHLLVAIAFALR